jgi:Holliday junction resolvasome RuvABC endonuclease subunit
MGVAVMEGSDLQYYAVKTITRRVSPGSVIAQARQIVEELIRRFKPSLLAVERPFLGYGIRSTLLVVVCKEIVELGRRLDCEVIQIGPLRVKKLVGGSGSATKRQVAEMVCRQFPELRVYLDLKGTKVSEKYWSNLFDAVAIALAAAISG